MSDLSTFVEVVSILFGIRLSFTTIKRNKSTAKTWSVVILKNQTKLDYSKLKESDERDGLEKNKQTMKLNWIVFKHKRLAARDLIQIVSPPAVWHIKQKAALALFIVLTSDPKKYARSFWYWFLPTYWALLLGRTIWKTNINLPQNDLTLLFGHLIRRQAVLCPMSGETITGETVEK